MTDEMIVKVQVPLATNGEALALVYNKSRSFDVFMRITPDLMKQMKGQPKRFFYARYDKKTNNTILEGSAPWQDW